jgi:hypothetical protein
LNRAAFALAVLLQTAAPVQTITPTPALSSYRIILVDGTEYVAREQFKVTGKLAVFTLLTTGRLVSIPLDTINQQATRAANAPLPEPPTPTPRKARTRIVLSGTPQPYESPQPAARFPGVLRFTGQGSRVITRLGLDAGLYIFRGEHVGQSNFAVWLLRENGENVALLANEIGVVNTFKAVRIERGADYVLSVQADGEWSIYVEKPN